MLARHVLFSSAHLAGDLGLANPTISLLVGLAIVSLLPFAALTLTSFVKIAVVLGIARSALGAQQLPPSSVVTGLSVILSLHVMSPVVIAAWDAAVADAGSPEEVDVFAGLSAARDPLLEFLQRHTEAEDVRLFVDIGKEARGDENSLHEQSLLVLAPAFMIGQLREAFRIGFLIFLPFLVVDLVVSCILLALGMHMLSPTTVSLPFKLLLFVAVDGWLLLSESLLHSYIHS